MTEKEAIKIINSNLGKFCVNYYTSGLHHSCKGCPLTAGGLCLKSIIGHSDTECLKKWKDLKKKP